MASPPLALQRDQRVERRGEVAEHEDGDDPPGRPQHRTLAGGDPAGEERAAGVDVDHRDHAPRHAHDHPALAPEVAGDEPVGHRGRHRHQAAADQQSASAHVVPPVMVASRRVSEAVVGDAPLGAASHREELGAGQEEQPPAAELPRAPSPSVARQQPRQIVAMRVEVVEPGVGRARVVLAAPLPSRLQRQRARHGRQQVETRHQPAGKEVAAHPVVVAVRLERVGEAAVAEDVDEQRAIGLEPAGDAARTAPGSCGRARTSRPKRRGRTGRPARNARCRPSRW